MSVERTCLRGHCNRNNQAIGWVSPLAVRVNPWQQELFNASAACRNF
jgi:hypothetical protein